MERRESKEDMVKSEIIKANYSLEEFKQFCDDHRGTNPNMYTYEEFQNLIYEFKKIFRPFSNQSIRNSYHDTLECTVLQESQLVTEPIVIQLMTSYDGMIKKMGKYIVTTLPYNWRVERKYSDFLWLRDLLTKLFPTLYIPALPSFKDKYDDVKEFKKLVALKAFMKYLAGSYMFRKFRVFVTFISERDDSLLEQLKKNYKKQKKVTTVEELQAPDGLVNSNLEDSSEIMQSYQKSISFFEHHMNSLSKQIKVIIDKSQELGECFNAFAKSCKAIAKTDWSYFDTRQACKEYFKPTAKIFQEMAKRQFGYNEILKQSVGEMIDFCALQMNPLKDLIREYGNLQNQFLKITTKKQKLDENEKQLGKKKEEKLDVVSKLLGVFNYHVKKEMDPSVIYWFRELLKEFADYMEKMSDLDQKFNASCLFLREGLDKTVSAR